MSDHLEQLRAEARTITEGMCPHCAGPLRIEEHREQRYGVCRACQLGYIAHVHGDDFKWSETCLWWLEEREPPPLDPDADILDVSGWRLVEYEPGWTSCFP